MAKRLISLRRILSEKIDRSRAWAYGEMAAGRFPKPIPGTCPNLWDEADIDRYIEEFVAAAKHRADQVAKENTARVAKAIAGRVRR